MKRPVISRRGPGRSAIELLASMDDIRGVVLTDVDLPRDPAPDPQSRTVQPEIHPTFVRHYTPPTYPLRVAQIPGGHLIGSGAVLTADGKLVFESLWNQEHLQRYFQPPPKFPEAVHIDGACASLISLWDDNFFHWMFNSLPRLAVLAASGVEYDRLLVPAELKPFQRATLEMIGVDLEKLVPFTGRHVQADLLIWVAPLAPLNEPSSFLLEWVKRSLGQADETPERLLYVSRKGGTRKAANEREIFAVLERLGFEFVLPEQLSFPDQVRLFAQTRLAVGPHGSNFVNGIFSRELTVLEFFQPAHVNWGVYSVLCAAGQDHWSILCEPVRSLTRTRHRRFDDMKVPLDLVMESLDRIASEQGLSLS